jgi:histidinol-phosphate aminotransferase
VSAQPFNRYPDPYQSALKIKLAAIKQVPSANIFLGNGSDEAIDLLFRAFCNPGKDNVIIMPPTYGMYEVSAGINDVAIKKVSLTPSYDMDVKGVLAAVDDQTKIIFICSPNNPSGNIINRQAIYQVLAAFSGLVVIDEAYIDFSDEPGFSSEIKQFPNLLVMQTLSKAWGLASLRLGMAYASEEIIGILNKIKPPYNISGLTQDTVLKAFDNTALLESMVQEILTEKENLKQELNQIKAVEMVYPSSANFLLVKVPMANKVYQELIHKKIIVRDRSKVQHCDDCLRITVGNKEENKQLVKALKEVLTKQISHQQN